MDWLQALKEQEALGKKRSEDNWSPRTIFGTSSLGNGQSSSFWDLLNQSTWMNNNSLLALLHSLGIVQTQGLTGSQRDDWNKQLLDMLLSYGSTVENRQYNEKLRDEQRNYDLPQNQLARLMSAGVSRDAAIQMLSGSGGSGGSGAAPYSDAAGVPEGIAPSQSRLNGVQADTAVVNTVFNAVGTVCSAVGSLGSFGVSASQMVAQRDLTQAMASGQKMQNIVTQNTLRGVEAAGTIIGAVSQAYEAGMVPKDKVFESSQDMLQFIRENQDFEPFGQLVKTGSLENASKDVYALNALNGAYDSWRKTRDYNLDRDHLITMYALDEYSKSIDIQKTISEIDVNRQEISASIARVKNDNLRVAIEQREQENRNLLTSVTVDKLTVETGLLDQQYEMQSHEVDWWNSVGDSLTDLSIQEFEFQLAQWRALENDPEAYNAAVRNWCREAKNRAMIADINAYYYSDELEGAVYNHPEGTGSFDKDGAFSVRSDRHSFHQWIIRQKRFFNLHLQSDGTPTQSERNALGKFAGDAAMMFLFRKFPAGSAGAVLKNAL